MIFNPVVSSGGAGSSAWKEVDRGYVAEHINDYDLNVLLAVFTPYYPNQPMIIPVSYVFCIGNAYAARLGVVTYGATVQDEIEHIVYVFSYPNADIWIAKDSEGAGIELELRLYNPSAENDIIPEGWSIKYFIYEG